MPRKTGFPGIDITRREAIASGVAVAALSAAGPLRIGAAEAETPKKGGILKCAWAHGSTTDSLDPATFENNYSQFMCYSMRGHLTEVSNTGELIPDLSESFEGLQGAAVWRFKLRKGVEFHNGKSMTAEDVVASINHHRSEDSKSAAKAILKPIKDVKADGDAVVFELEAGNADFPFLMADYHLAILPAKDGKPDWQSGQGTGAFVLQNYEPGVSASLTANPNFYKEGRGHFDGLELLTVADATARNNALTTGEVDVIDRVDLKTAHLLARNKEVRVEETSGTQHYTFAMRCDTDPFKDNNVRLALKYGIDRDAIVKTILRGHGVVGNDHPIGRSNRYHASELPQRTYDPDKSKFHLKQAGLSSLTVDLSAADAAFAGSVDAAVLYKEHAAKAGITINVVREPNDGYWSNVWMKKPWSAVYWGGRPTEDWMFSTAYAEGAAWNDSFWIHERFNKLLKEARTELDEAKRREMYVEMQRIVSDEGGVVVPMFANYVFAMRKNVQHGEMAANWSLDGNKGAERWWFA